MRILVAAEHLGHAGGMERYLAVVLPALVERGATVHVLARRIDAIPLGVTAETIAWADEHDEPAAAAQREVQRATAAFRPDVAVAHNVMDAGVVESLRAVPSLVYHVHDHRPFCPNGDRLYPRSARICGEPIGIACARRALTDGCAYGPRARTVSLIRRRHRLRDAIAASDSVAVASRYMRAVATANGVAPERIVTIAPPLSERAFRDDAPPGTSRTVVFAGRVVPQKGLDALVRAVARIAAASRPELAVLGDGAALANVLDVASRRGVAVRAHGVVMPDAVRDTIDRAALVALPSVWAEPFGYVGIEALARARPVVAFDVGGVRDWLEHGANGTLVARGDEDALGGAIAELLDDVDRRSRYGREARRTAERYRLPPIADGLMRAYTQRSSS